MARRDSATASHKHPAEVRAFLSIAYYYTGTIKDFRNNLIQYSKLQENSTFTIKNFFAQILASGLIIHLIFSTIINICMVMGLLPIVGIPLPFMSYGISHLWITFASLGWFNSIAMRRFYLSMSVHA